METIKVGNTHIELQKLDKLIYKTIPSGYQIRTALHKYNDEIDLSQLRCKVDGKINLDHARKSLGTLGGGNHFILRPEGC